MFAVCVATIRHDESGVCWHAATDIAADVETDDAAFELPTEVDEGCGCWRWRGHVKRDRTRRDMLYQNTEISRRCVRSTQVAGGGMGGCDRIRR